MHNVMPDPLNYQRSCSLIHISSPDTYSGKTAELYEIALNSTVAHKILYFLVILGLNLAVTSTCPLATICQEFIHGFPSEGRARLSLRP